MPLPTPVTLGIAAVVCAFGWPFLIPIAMFVVPLIGFFAVLLFAWGLYAGAGWRDYKLLGQMISLQMTSSKYIRNNLLIPDHWNATFATVNKSKTAFFFVDTKKGYTFQEVEDKSNQVARFFYEKGFRAGDVVSLFCENCPEFFMMWLGLAKIGVRTALINHNLRRKQLQHCVTVVDCKGILFASNLGEAIYEVVDDLGIPADSRFRINDNDGISSTNPYGINLDLLLHKTSAEAIPKSWTAQSQGVKVKDPVLFVYTSGTTGLPKAAKVSHWRQGFAPQLFAKTLHITSEDVIYCALPMYHSAASFLGISHAFMRGATVVLRKKFSASNFMKDCRDNDVTVIQYIGELCRYLLAVPKHSLDGKNKIRLAIGNGLRPDIWVEFRDRFQIGQIGEFYAATEGAAGLLNMDNKEFAIGYSSPLIRPVSPLQLIQFDVKSETPIRDANGRCIRCKPGETGEFIAKIMNFANGVSNFSGYTNKAASDKKVLHDVFKKGDAWFRSGDLLRMDDEGYCYFVDRIGDTFRWKGENCATSEIAEVMSTAPKIPTGVEINVYGVQIEGKDGRAGMAALSGSNVGDVDLKALAAHVCANLPGYSRPLFVRIMPADMDITSTFKHKKVELRDAGFNPSTIKDDLYFLQNDQYVKLDASLYNDIINGKVRL